MTPSAALSLVVASSGLLLGGLLWLMGRAAGWPVLGRGAAVVTAAALYCACNVVITLPVTDATVVVASQLNMFFAGLHILAWTRFLPVHDGRAPASWELWLGRAAVVASALSLVPGLLFGGVFTARVAWLDMDQHCGQSTLVGDAVMVGLTLALLLLMVDRVLRRGQVAYGRTYAAAMGTVFVAGVWDTSVTLGWLQQPFILDLAMLVVVAAVARTMMGQVAHTTRSLERLRADLEQAVRERTRQLEDARDALVASETLAALGRVAAGVAHEINNPLAAIRGNLEFLDMTLTDQTVPPHERQEALRDTVGSVDRIARVVRSLMDAGRRSGRAPVDVGAVRLLDCVEHALAAASTVAAPNVDTTVQVPDALVVEGDQGVLVQILSNLLVNARQAMRRDGVTRGTVHVVARQVDAWVQVDVVDDGPGIPQQVQKRLFEPFFTTRDPGDGTGLGLAVANGLAHALGARLTLAHTGAGGTTMRLTLRAAAPVPAPSLLPLLPGTRKRLLVVDDEPAVLRALQRVLSPRHDVTLSATVEDGLRHALGGAVDVILCDVMMPDGGAQQFYTQLQSTRPDLLERLVFITGGATNDATAAFLRRAGRPVLEKPVDPAALSRVVDASGPPSLTQDQGHPAHVPVH